MQKDRKVKQRICSVGNMGWVENQDPRFNSGGTPGNERKLEIIEAA